MYMYKPALSTTGNIASNVPNSGTNQEADIHFRLPCKADGFALHQLIAACPPLDPNSIYCNLLQCHHFAETCVAAERDSKLLGFVSGYLIPNEPDTLFIWQVAVHTDARGLGLAKHMIRAILERPGCGRVRRLKTTITPDNDASWGMFRSLARDLGARIDEQVEYERDAHFGGHHDDETLLTIGPITHGGSPQ